MKKLFGIITAGAVTASLAGCGGLKYDEAEFRWSDSVVATDLNSATSSYSTDFLILNNIGEGLVRRNDNDEPDVTTTDEINYVIHDGLAKAAKKTVNEDKTVTWTFTLRDGIKWSNGDAITAKDFEFGFQQLANPANAAGYSSMADLIVGGEDVRNGIEEDLSQLQAKALENGEFEVTLVQEVPYFLPLMSFEVFQPIHKGTWDAAGGVGGRYGKETKYTISSGPYVVKDWDTEYGIYLEKNDQYWDKDNVEINSISNRRHKEQTSALSSYNKGDLDRVSLSGSNYSTNANKPEMNLVETSTVFYLVPNLNSEFTADPYVREALARSLDLEVAANAMKPYVPATALIQEGLVSIGTGDDSKDFTEWNEVTERYNTPRPKDLAAANNAYSQSNFKGTNKDANFMAFDQESSKPLVNSLTDDLSSINNVTGKQDLRPSTDVYKQYDKNSGYLQYTETLKTFNEEDSSFTVKNPEGTWDLGWYGWGPDYADPTTFLDIFKGADSHNMTGLDQFDEKSYSVEDGKLVVTAATEKGPYNRIVTKDGKTAAQASAIYDGYLSAANDALIAGNTDGYYDNLALAEAYLIDNYFAIPVVRKVNGFLLNTKFEGLRFHAYGSDYTWKDVTIK